MITLDDMIEFNDEFNRRIIERSQERTLEFLDEPQLDDMLNMLVDISLDCLHAYVKIRMLQEVLSESGIHLSEEDADNQ